MKKLLELFLKISTSGTFIFILVGFFAGLSVAKVYYQNPTNFGSILSRISGNSINFSVISQGDVTANLLKNPPEQLGPSPKRTGFTSSPITVTNKKEIRNAIDSAKPGDVIVIAPGEYRFIENYLYIEKDGFDDMPITLKAEVLGTVTIISEMVEGFLLEGSNWHFENLVIDGRCGEDQRCEHAFHIIGDADNTIVKNNIIKNFNAHFKINSTDGNSPDFGVIENNLIYNDNVRDTDSSVTLIDAVAVDDWTVSNNIIADFAKGGGNQISYGGFFKGTGKKNIFEQNLIMCEWQHKGGVRLGLSFGGGGTDEEYCDNFDCSTEHFGGVIRNNIIMNCPLDVGIYINRAAATSIYNNIIYNTTGIDVRFPTSDAIIYNNIIDGRIKNRESGTNKASNNYVGESSDKSDTIIHKYFKDPENLNFEAINVDSLKEKGLALGRVSRDICGILHQEDTSDIGPFVIQDDASCQTNLEFITDYTK